MDRFNSDAVISAFTEEQAFRLTGVSLHQLRNWDRTKFFSPRFADENRRAAFSRVYSFQDIAALRVLNVLTKQYSVSVQHLRDVAKKLGTMDNGAWSRTTLYVLKSKVNFDDPADGKQREIVSGQYSIGLPLEKIMSDTKRDISALSNRNTEQIGKIEKNRLVYHNTPVIAGTRVPVRAIKNFHAEGFSVDQIISEYPTLKSEDVLAAIAYVGGSKAA